ncbi:uncharacterized protein LOC116166393 [Photinus pyralis]|uniref:uncharacterized protein LOC116166393 n=1 Tax=Photinus pyralis TaxID=7054 RepID=UPI001267266C|nr:uncharacterized protein LOC116166393 [Photinus pyralis]
MDVEKLINLIYEKKPLWDMTDKSYHMRDIQRKLWQEVAVEMNTKVDEVKSKWRGLRDTFRKEFNKSKKQKSGDGAESVVTSKWPYYKILLFLSKTVERRKLHGNISPQKENNDNSSSETESTLEAADNAYSDTQSTIQESSQQIVNTDIHQPSTSGNKVTSTFNKPSSSTLQSKKNTNNRLKYAKNSETNSMDEKFLEIERAKLEILSQHKNREGGDSEHQFLLSLLPFLKAVPHNRQMLVRSAPYLLPEELLADVSNHVPDGSPILISVTPACPPLIPVPPPLPNDVLPKEPKAPVDKVLSDFPATIYFPASVISAL